MIPHYARIATHILVAAPKTERAARPEELFENIPPDFPREKKSLPDISSALDGAFSSSADVICIAGSFFTVGEAMECLNINPY
jgi:folylpolyglutamate synthase/dihydropteroate synthase